MQNKTIFRFAGCAITGLLLSTQVLAATTDLATTPLATASSTSVLPNVFLMMDDSGSMDWDYMPDVGNNPVFSTSTYGYASSQCNGVYYDPAITYTPPANSDGSSFSNSSFTGAWMDGFKTSKGTVNLSTTFQIGLYQSSSAPSSGVPAYYYQYVGTQTAASQKNYYNSSTTFYQECNTTAAGSPTAKIKVSGSSSTTVSSITVNGVAILSTATSSSSTSSTVASNIASQINAYGNGYSATSNGGSTVTITGPNSAAGFTPVITSSGGMTLTPSAFSPFIKVVVSSTSGPNGTDERTNFANWFSYYRTRINMMKSGTGLAFKPLDNHYRVGFATMNNNGGSKFLNLATFDSTQKSAWYTMLYSTSASNSTPLLKALSNAGLMYANRLPSNTLNGVSAADPMQYSCQQNFTILSTDGFWNDATNSDLNGNAVGDQDSGQPRPYTDGGNATQTATTPTTTIARTQTVTSGNIVTTQWTQTTVSTAKNTGGTAPDGTTCTNKQYIITKKTQNYTETANTNTTQTSDTTTTTVETVVTANGVTTSDTISAPSTTGPVVTTTTATNSDTGAPGTNSWSSGTTAYSCASKVGGSTGLPSAGNKTVTQTSTSSTVAGTQTVTTSTIGPTVGQTTTTTSITGGTYNTLADVAMYYYSTDLRTSDLGNCTGALGAGVDVCKNNVTGANDDKAAWQHMTTFTLGLGAQGRMIFSPSYKTDTSGDYYSVKNGVIANPTGGVCSWGTSGQVCNWPTPNPSGTPENIDDLWHAAVNGRGSYFSATNPNTLSTGLSTALAGVSALTGSSSSATTSSPIMVPGNNAIYSSNFTTGDWTGELLSQQYNATTKVLSSTIDWDAQTLLDNATPASRNIYTYDATATNASHYKNFTWDNLTTTEQGYFSGNHISTLSQFCTGSTTCLDSATQTAAGGANLVNFLRGDRTNEGAVTDTTKYYRQRSHILGDIVDSQAAYVQGSVYSYSDAGYSDFVTSNKTRQAMIYVGSNDGMLHAFHATTGNTDSGAEAWAYIPSFVLPNLYKLADKNYTNLHQYYVDGTPVVGDVYFSADKTWHTILVGGLNGGGQGYYALDITNPASPSVLWEFSDSNLGYSYGNPVITKLQDGTWVVLVTSGYNNSSGDGQGRLYVINAATGALIRSISTGVGSPSAPSGLAKINAWVASPAINNTALRAYGGDLQGNLWRFDINGGTAQLLATLEDANGNVQPITVKPELGSVNGNAVVYVGTGRYLGVSDLADTSQQSFYAIKDNLATSTNSIYGNPRADAHFIQQTESMTSCPAAGIAAGICSTGQDVRTSTSNAVNFATDYGWYFDFPATGERDNTDPMLALGIIAFTSNIPDASACASGGYSFTYYLDYATGGAIAGTGSVVATSLDSSIGNGITLFQTPDGKLGGVTTCGDKLCIESPPGPSAPSGNLRRVSWHELIND
jgi:type IV pilus assembly protein PilY1